MVKQCKDNEKKTPIVEMPKIAFIFFCLCTQMCVTLLYGDKMKGLRYNGLTQWTGKQAIPPPWYKELKKICPLPHHGINY